MNSVFYSPNMVQWSSRPAFKGQNMERDYRKEIKEKININTIPEVGDFAPVSAELKLENNERVAFCVTPSEENRKAKSLAISHIGPKMPASSRFKEFPDKAKLLLYIDRLENFEIENMISELREAKNL